jgi:hypothetical protein
MQAPVWSLYIAAASSIGIDDPIMIVQDVQDTGIYRIDDLEPGKWQHDTCYNYILISN